MLEQVLHYMKNWFLTSDGKHYGTFTVEGGSFSGTMNLPFLQDGQYYRVIGSVFNDGVHQYPSDDLVPETFTGCIWALAVPRAVVDLADEIKQWNDKNASIVTGPYQSESFGGYSYTLKADGGAEGGTSWQSTFAGRLNQWRKL